MSKTKPCPQCHLPFGPGGKMTSGNFKKAVYCGRSCYVAASRHTPEKSLAIMWSQINKNGPGGCWIWSGSTNNMGYPSMSYAGKPMVAVHRFLYQRTVRKLKPQEWCLHRCDVPRCVNPAHIFIGDHKANMADMWAKKRAKTKFTDEEVLAIRREFDGITGRVPQGFQKRVAEKYKTSDRWVWAIRTGRAWKHVRNLSSTSRNSR